jgi:hypothetical protein
MKKRPSGKLKVLKAYNAGHVSLAPGDVVQVEQEFAEKLILGGFAEFEPDDEFDRAIERAHAANPEAVKRMIAWVDAEVAAGRCSSMETLCAEEKQRLHERR